MNVDEYVKRIVLYRRSLRYRERQYFTMGLKERPSKIFDSSEEYWVMQATVTQ